MNTQDWDGVEIECPQCEEPVQANAEFCQRCGFMLGTKLARVEQYRDPKWNPGIAAVLSLVIPGAGQMYKGHVIRGLLWLGAVSLGYMFLFVPGMVLHVACILFAASGDPRK